MAHAHICAERALASEGMVAEKASGQVHICVCVCRERERELPPSNPIVIYGEDLEKQSYCWGGGVWILSLNAFIFCSQMGCTSLLILVVLERILIYPIYCM